MADESLPVPQRTLKEKATDEFRRLLAIFLYI